MNSEIVGYCGSMSHRRVVWLNFQFVRYTILQVYFNVDLRFNSRLITKVMECSAAQGLTASALGFEPWAMGTVSKSSITEVIPFIYLRPRVATFLGLAWNLESSCLRPVAGITKVHKFHWVWDGWLAGWLPPPQTPTPHAVVLTQGLSSIWAWTLGSSFLHLPSAVITGMRHPRLGSNPGQVYAKQKTNHMLSLHLSYP